MTVSWLAASVLKSCRRAESPHPCFGSPATALRMPHLSSDVEVLNSARPFQLQSFSLYSVPRDTALKSSPPEAGAAFGFSR